MTMGNGTHWVVICIDWKAPNVVERGLNREQAASMATLMDEVALRCIAVPEGDPRILYTATGE